MTYIQQLQSGDYRPLIKPLLWVAIAVLVATLALSVKHDITELKAPIDVTLPPNLMATSNTTSTSIQMRHVANMHLLGNPAAPPEAPVAQQANLPKTNLQLDLHGTFTNSVAEKASALIAPRNQEAQLYSVGQQLPGGATLHAVHPDSVTLSRGGKLEVLAFQNITISQAPKPYQRPTSNPNMRRASAIPDTAMEAAQQRLQQQRRQGFGRR